jgi:hypothetical protein
LRSETGNRVLGTEWHRITCLNSLGKAVAEHSEKGMKVPAHGPSPAPSAPTQPAPAATAARSLPGRPASRAAGRRPGLRPPIWSTATTGSRSESGVAPPDPAGQPAGSLWQIVSARGKPGQSAAQDRATLGLGVTGATARRPVIRAGHSAGG